MQSSLFQEDYKFMEYSASKYALYSIQQSFLKFFLKKIFILIPFYLEEYIQVLIITKFC